MDQNTERNLADAKPDQKSDLQKRREMKPRVTKLRIYEAFAALCLVIAGFFLGLNFLGFNPQRLAMWATGFFFAGLLLSGFALRLWLINNHKKRSVANFWWCVVVIPSGGVCTLLIWLVSQPTTRPRLILAFSPSKAGHVENTVQLTSNFFLIPRGALKSSNMRGAIIVPIESGQTNVAVTFSILNTNEEPFEFAQLRIESDFKRIIFGTGWSEMRPSFPFSSAAVMTCDPKFLPPLSCTFPELTFSPIVETNRTIVFAHVGAKGFEPMDLAFWLVFSSKVKKPHALEVGIKFKDSTNFDLDIPNPEYRKP